jgi:hypothetical protein
MKRLIFELSMPANNSWNNNWSGQDNKCTVAKDVTEKKAKTLSDYYSYSFGDGWVAAVTVRPAKPKEKATNKFCGYNWMIDSILYNNKIEATK